MIYLSEKMQTNSKNVCWIFGLICDSLTWPERRCCVPRCNISQYCIRFCVWSFFPIFFFLEMHKSNANKLTKVQFKINKSRINFDLNRDEKNTTDIFFIDWTLIWFHSLCMRMVVSNFYITIDESFLSNTNGKANSLIFFIRNELK